MVNVNMTYFNYKLFNRYARHSRGSVFWEDDIGRIYTTPTPEIILDEFMPSNTATIIETFHGIAQDTDSMMFMIPIHIARVNKWTNDLSDRFAPQMGENVGRLWRTYPIGGTTEKSKHIGARGFRKTDSYILVGVRVHLYYKPGSRTGIVSFSVDTRDRL